MSRARSFQKILPKFFETYVFVTNGPSWPQGFVLCISQILIFLPQLYDYYLSSSIFDLKISYILNKIKSPPPPVFLKPFLLDDVKNQTEV